MSDSLPLASGAPATRVGTSLPEVGDVSRQTMQLLARAKVHADAVRAEADAAVVSAMQRAQALTLEADRLHQQAQGLHAAAASARDVAAETLAAARADAASMLDDAAAQAALVAEAAARSSQFEIESARTRADEITSAAQAEAQRVLAGAAREAEAGRLALASARDTHDADVTRRLADLASQEHEVMTRATAAADQMARNAQRSAMATTSEATEHARVVRAAADQLIEQTIVECAEQRRLAAATSADLVASARAEAQAELAAAEAHVTWANATMRSILDGAAADAALTRTQTARALADHSRRRRQQLQSVLARVSHQTRSRIEAAADEAARLRAQAAAVLEAAESDAQRTVRAAAEEASAVQAAADMSARSLVERARARLADAEAGARIIRERTAAEVEKLHREAHADRRSAREELVSTLAEARSGSDRLREEARLAVDNARAEVAALAARRDDITTQLTHLSGVIEALAVPESIATPPNSSSARAPLPFPSESQGPS